MNRSRAQSQQNVRKSGGRIARHKSLEASNVSATKSYHYESLLKKKESGDKKERQSPSTNCNSSANEDWTFHSRNTPALAVSNCRNSESSGIQAESEASTERKESTYFTEETRKGRDTVAQPSASEMQSSDGEQSIPPALPVSRDRNTPTPTRRSECRQETGNQVGFADKNVKESTPKKYRENVEGSELRKIFRDNYTRRRKSKTQSERNRFNSFSEEIRVIRDIVPRTCSTSASDIQSSDEDKRILAMPVEVSRDRDPFVPIQRLVYGQQTRNQACFVENDEEHQTDIRSEDGSELRHMIPDGSYIISKENYIISNQTRLPSEILMGQRQPRKEAQSPGIAAGSVSEVADIKLNVTAVCVLVFLLALTCLACYFLFFKSAVPGATTKNTSLLRYLLEHAYEALLQIYE